MFTVFCRGVEENWENSSLLVIDVNLLPAFGDDLCEAQIRFTAGQPAFPMGPFPKATHHRDRRPRAKSISTFDKWFENIYAPRNGLLMSVGAR